MAKRFSDVVGVTSEELWAEGAFDAFIDIDARFHIDPHLLEKTTIPELKDAYGRLKNHFVGILSLLEVSRQPGDFFYKQAYKKLLFKEFDFICLGYTKDKTRRGAQGSGIGPKIAAQITRTAAELVRGGTKNPLIFELVGLFETGVGADRISDMTARVIAEDLMRFTERVCRNLQINTWSVNYKGTYFHVPLEPRKNKPLVFVPYEILRPLPIAEDWTDLDIVTVYNAELRTIFNKVVGITWKDATNERKLKKEKLKEILLKDPELRDDLIHQYKIKPPEQYDFENDPLGCLLWYKVAQEWAAKYPLLLSDVAHVTPEKIHEVVMRICNHFKRVLALHGLSHELYIDGERLKKEAIARLIFYAIAETYCEANNLDLSLDAQGGREMVKFKMSRGRAKVYVSVKYSRNANVVEQYAAAVANYEILARDGDVIFLVIRTHESLDTLESLQKLKSEATRDGRRVPELVIADGRITEITRGRLWEFGFDDEKPFEVKPEKTNGTEKANGHPAKGKQGPRNYSTEEKLAALDAWERLDRDTNPINLEDWLIEYFGTDAAIPRVAKSTFHGWRRLRKKP